MTTETVDKKNKTITVETDYIFSEFKISKYRDYFHFDFIKNKNQSMGCAIFFNKFGGRKYYPTEITVKKVDTEKGRVELSYKR